MNEDNTIEPNEPEPTLEAAAENGTATDAADGDLGKLIRERDEMYDRLLRKGAEFDNYRKRVEKERRELTEWAAADVLSEVLARRRRLSARA